ncbi:MAG: hypothetical protein HY097_08995, partial [Nitrospinae bacterium]|nr:hypothetical protein [Nitrospinota bacterium]
SALSPGGKIELNTKTPASPLTGQGSVVTPPPTQASKSPPLPDFSLKTDIRKAHPIIGIIGDSFTQKPEKNGTRVEMNLFNTHSADASLEIRDKNGNLQKTVIIPGIRASTDVTVSNPIKGAENLYKVEKRAYDAITDQYPISDKRDSWASEKTQVSEIVPPGGSMKISYNSGTALAHNMLTLVTEALDIKLSKKEDIKTLNDVLQKIDLPKIIVDAKAGSSNNTDLAEKVLQGVLSEVAKEGGTKLAFDKIVGEKAAEKVSKALVGVPGLTAFEEGANKLLTGAVALVHLNDVVSNLVNGTEEVVITPTGADSKLVHSKTKPFKLPEPVKPELAKTGAGTTVLDQNTASSSSASEPLKIESTPSQQAPSTSQKKDEKQDEKQGVKHATEVLPQQQTTPQSPVLNLTTLSTATLDIKKEENHLTTFSRHIQDRQPTSSSQSSQTGQSGVSSTQPTATQSSQSIQPGTSSVQTNVIFEQRQSQTGATNAANTKFDDIKIDFVKKTRVKVDVIF